MNSALLFIAIGVPIAGVMGFSLGMMLSPAYWKYRLESKKLESTERLAVLAAKNQREQHIWNVTTTTVPTNDP